MRLEIWHQIVISATKHQHFKTDFLLLLLPGTSNMKRNFILLHKIFMFKQEKEEYVCFLTKLIFSTMQQWLSTKMNMKSLFFWDILFLKCGSFSLCSALTANCFFPFICTPLAPVPARFEENMCDIWAWHSVNRQAMIGTRLLAVCLMPCLLWKSPWNRCSKYSHWSRGRGPTMM